MMMIMTISYDDQNLDQGNRQIAMRIVGGGGWWLVFRNNLRLYLYIWMWLVLVAIGIPQQPEVISIFRTNLKWAFVSIRLSVSPTNHPPMHPFLHPSIHPCLSTCPVDKLTSKNGCVHPSTWPSAKEVPGMLMTNQWRNRESTSTKSTVYNLALSVSSLWYG